MPWASARSFEKQVMLKADSGVEYKATASQKDTLPRQPTTWWHGRILCASRAARWMLTAILAYHHPTTTRGCHMHNAR